MSFFQDKKVCLILKKKDPVVIKKLNESEIKGFCISVHFVLYEALNASEMTCFLS